MNDTTAPDVFKIQPAKLRDHYLPYLVEEIRGLSDAQPDALRAFGEVFLEAHARCPGRPSLEIGTRAGGSAFMFLHLLDLLYDAPPMFFTVDPYGLKPYRGGDHPPDDRLRPYGDPIYATAKQALVNYPNHSHFLLESMDFFSSMKNAGFWWRGTKIPFARSFAFIFLDGNHDAESVLPEVNVAVGDYLAPNGSLAIDNAFNDPRIKQTLEREMPANTEGRPAAVFFGREWAVIR